MVFKWLKDNKMLDNQGKCHAIILYKNNHIQAMIKSGNKVVKVRSSINLFEAQNDAELNFNLCIVNICRPETNQLNALILLRKFLGFEEKKVVISNYFYSSLNYYPPVWMFSHVMLYRKGYFVFSLMTTVLCLRKLLRNLLRLA